MKRFNMKRSYLNEVFFISSSRMHNELSDSSSVVAGVGMEVWVSVTGMRGRLFGWPIDRLAFLCRFSTRGVAEIARNPTNSPFWAVAPKGRCPVGHG